MGDKTSLTIINNNHHTTPFGIEILNKLLNMVMGVVDKNHNGGEVRKPSTASGWPPSTRTAGQGWPATSASTFIASNPFLNCIISPAHHS